jgi:hypothetical protein
MEREKTRPRGVQIAGAACALLLALGLAGCGGEPQQAAPAPPAGVVPGGGSQADYQKHMQDTARGAGGGGGAPVAPPGAPK